MSAVQKLQILVIFFIFVETQSQLYGPNRPQTIHNIFQIPIQTLTAVSNVVENTRPIGDVIQQRIMRLAQLQQDFSGPSSNSVSSSIYANQQASISNRRFSSRASQIAGVSVAADGSGFRI